MSNPSSEKTPVNKSILATKVTGNRRSSILWKYFQSTFMSVETWVYGFTDRLCKNYSGGYWEFYELSNGGFYMAPNLKELMEVDVPFGNLYAGTMSADALGITVCLFAYSYLAEQNPDGRFGDFYWHLRMFARNHAEASAIFSAID